MNIEDRVQKFLRTVQEAENDIPSEMFQNIENKIIIQNIQHRANIIKQYCFNPQTLEIVNYNLLRGTPDEHWKNKIYTLFCDANLPNYWIVDIWKKPSDNINKEIPPVVYIQIISFCTKMFVKNTLTYFFKNHQMNIHVYD